MIGTVHEIETFSWLGIREPFSSLSHFIGAVIFVFMASDLIHRSRGDRIKSLSVVVFAICGLQQLLISSAYHLLWPGPARDFMLRTDVSAVFLLIAGSVTPVHAILFSGAKRWGALSAIWTIAIGAIIWRLAFCQDHPGPLGITFFLACGWSCAVTAHVLQRRYGWVFVRPAAISGLAYTLGAIVLLSKWPNPIPGVIGPHELWHVAVLIALAMHWRFLRQFTAGPFAMNSFADATQIAPISIALLEAEPVASCERR